jgi:hypothetical protein
MNEPFGSGSMRLAYLATIEKQSQLLVAKQWKTSQKNALTKCLQQLKCHQLAIKYSDIFNEKLKKFGEKQKLKFLAIKLLVIEKDKKEEFYTLEEYIPGDYVKFNNNYKFVNNDYAEYPIFQCFSHFTFLESGCKEMVVDIQGVIATKGDYHVLTDPAVHSQGTMKQFGMGDLGNLGMKAFNCAHECGEICLKLGYMSLQSLVADDEDEKVIKKTKSTSRDEPLCYVCFEEVNSKPKSVFAPCGHSLHTECFESMKKNKKFKDYCHLCTQKVELVYK